MKFDTVLRACLKRTYDAAAGIGDPIKVRRQQGTFRTWLVRHDEHNKMRIAELENRLAFERQLWESDMWISGDE